jgi:hypothetical protein
MLLALQLAWVRRGFRRLLGLVGERRRPAWPQWHRRRTLAHRCVAHGLAPHTVGVLPATVCVVVVVVQAVAVPVAVAAGAAAAAAQAPRPVAAMPPAWVVPAPPIVVGTRFQVFVYDYYEPAAHPGLAHVQHLVFIPAALRREDNGEHLDCVRVLDGSGRSLGWVAHTGLPAVRSVLDSGAAYTASFMKAKYNQHRHSKQVHGPTLTLRITALPASV